MNTFLNSEAAQIMARAPKGADDPSLPRWITSEQKRQFRQLSPEQMRRIRRLDANSRIQPI